MPNRILAYASSYLRIILCLQQYELSRECIQQLALRVCVSCEGVVRALRTHEPARLDTQALADVARAVCAVKPLACWLERAPDLAAVRVDLLRLALEAATCAMRDRWSEQPARAVAAACAAAAAAAAHIVREARDPLVLQPAALHAVTLKPRASDLGFVVRRSVGGHLRLASVRFGSAAHASGAVHAGDEIVQVGGACVLGWDSAAVERACCEAAARGELALRLRRREARPPPALPRRPRRDLSALLAPARPLPAPDPPVEPAAGDVSDDSEPLSPPASPTLHLDHTRYVS